MTKGACVSLRLACIIGSMKQADTNMAGIDRIQWEKGHSQAWKAMRAGDTVLPLDKAIRYHGPDFAKGYQDGIAAWKRRTLSKGAQA
jgi:hypothetical protein